MHDLLFIRWSTAESFHYQKTGPISEKIFTHEADTTYAGVLYSSASAGLFQLLEFYDHETGRLYYPDGVSKMMKVIGASCADALIWSWNTVCTSIEGLYYPNTMIYVNGYYPVGDLVYPNGGKVLIDRTNFNGDNRVGVPKVYKLTDNFVFFYRFLKFLFYKRRII